MPQPTVFVSYSHRDEEEKEKLSNRTKLFQYSD